jgi:HEAT repeat protein
VQRAAVVGAGERAAPELRPLLIAAFASPDASIRLVAVSSLARFENTENELGAAAFDDPDAAVRGAALGLLASRSDSAASRTLLDLLIRDPESTTVVAALGQNVDQRIASILARLEAANDGLARALLAVLARSESHQGRAALDVALASPNVVVRRATARVLSLLLDDSAKSSLTRAASNDADAEVRRICAAAMA